MLFVLNIRLIFRWIFKRLFYLINLADNRFLSGYLLGEIGLIK